MSFDPVGIAASVGKALVGPCLNYTKKEINFIIDYDSNMKRVNLLHRDLEDKKEEVLAYLEEGERQGRKAAPTVKHWLENELPEFTNTMDQKLLMDEEGLMKAGRCCFGRCLNPFSRHHLSKKAVEKADEMNSLITKMNDHGGVFSVTLPAPPPMLSSFSGSHNYVRLESRENKMNEILKRLKDGFNRIGIWGTGGAGKSMFVEELARRVEQENLFPKVVIAEISEFPDIRMIQDQIAERIGFTDLAQYHNNQERAIRLGNRIKELILQEEDKIQSEVKEKKKLLLILDNIWKKLDLGPIGIPHEFLTNKGCSLVVTSRREDVCHKMDATNDVIEMGTLNEEEAKQLFREKIGKNPYTEEHDKITTEILDGCARLPISINILADRLKTQSLRTWRTTTEDIKKSIRGDKRIFADTYSVIKMSYDMLEDSEAKTFFLLCCLFPSRSYVRIHDLLRYAIGLGLLERMSSLTEAIQQVFDLAKKLTSLSLLSEIDVDKGVVRIHDDVREAGISFAIEGKYVFHVGPIPKWLNKDSYKKYTVFSVVSDSSYEYLTGQELTDLTLLHIVGIDGSKLCDNYFRGMKFLKVLHLSKFDMETLPASIGHLENLQTLLLEYCSLGDMSTIFKLWKLQVLSLKGSRVSTLPKEISCLVRLKLLDLTDCIWLNRIPSSLLVKLNLLEGLYMKNSFSNWQTTGNSACLSELESMHDLQVLEIEINCMEQLPARDLPFKDVSSYMIHVAVSKPWNKNLWSSSKDLQVNGLYFGDLVKQGFKHFVSQAETLFLDNIQDLKNLAPHVDKFGLRRLKQLRVANCLTMESMVSMTVVHQMVGFPELQVLHLEHLAQLIAIYHRETPSNTFSNLQEVTLSHLDRLTDCALFAQHATKLEVLNVKSCKNLEYVFLSLFKDREGSQENIKLDFLRKLHLEDLPRLIGLWLETKIESCSSPDLQSESDSPRFYHFCDGDNDIDNAARKNILFPNKGIFPCLEHLHLENVSNIEGLWDITTSRQFSTMLPTLRTLCLIRMDKLKHVWSKELRKGKHNFESFKEIKIEDCDSLESIFSPLVDESTLMNIRFEELQTMEMTSLDSFRYFLKGNVNLDFPSLKELSLFQLKVIKAFVEVEDPEASMFIDTVLFTKKVIFRRLETLVLVGLYSIMELWDSPMVEEFSSMLPIMQSLYIFNIEKLRYVWRSNEISRESRNNNMIINIKELRVKACSSLESLIHVDAVGGSMELPCLEYLYLGNLREFRCLMEKEERSEFPALKKLTLWFLENMKTLIVNHGSSEGALFDGKVKFPALEELYLGGLYVMIKQLWAFKTGEEFSNIFSSLQTLRLFRMDKLRYIWSMVLWGGSHSFRSLKEIEIFHCSSLESLFPPVPANNSSLPLRVKFPQLQRLVLEDLPDFKCLLQGNVELESSALREVELRRLLRLITLVVDKLQWTKTPERGCDLLLPTPLFNQKLLLPSLEKLRIDDVLNVETLWVITSCEEFNSKYPNLQSLDVKHMDTLKQIWFKGSEYDNENRPDFNFFPSLEIMKIESCYNLVSLISPAVVTGYNQQPQSQSPKMASFPKLQELYLSALFSFRSPFTRNSDMDFQDLKQLTVMGLPFNILLKLEKSDSEGGASKEEIQRKEKALKIEEAEEEIALFNNIRFPSLEQLMIDFKICNKNEENDHDDDNNNSSSSLLPKLKQLDIQRVEPIHFPRAIIRKSLLSLTLSNIEDVNYLVSPPAAADASTHSEAVFTSPSELLKLEELIILRGYSLVELFTGTVEDSRPLTNLKNLKLDSVSKLKRVPWQLLPNLQSLNIINCSLENTDFLFPADSLSEGSSLQLLESMEIRHCWNMQSIIKDDQEQHFKHHKDGQIVFPKLKEIELHSLSLLCTFNSSSYRIHFPSLVKFTMRYVPTLTSFSSGPVVNPELIEVESPYTDEITVDAEDLNTIVQRHIQKRATRAYWLSPEEVEQYILLKPY